MKRGIITILLVAAALGGIVYLLNKNKANNEAVTAEASKMNSTVAVRVDTVRQQSVDMAYLSNGTFQPKQEVVVSAEAAGRVVRVLVDEGDHVSAGQTLAIVQGDKLNVNVANAEANFNNAKADLERFESAYKSGGVTKQQLDGAKLQFETAKNNVQAAKLNAGDVTIKTSVAGVVNSRKIEPGTYVNPGTPAFEIVNVNTLKLRVNVDEKNVAPLQVGQDVEITVSVQSDKKYTGKITFIAPKADASLNFPVEIEIANPNNALRAGMYGTARFGGEGQANALVIPRNAFVGSISDQLVYVAKDGKAVQSKVVPGRTFGNMVEVVDGVNEGELVIISGQINLADQTPISVIN